MEHFLEVKNLSVSFKNEDGVTRAVNDVSFHVDAGEIVSFVGESGSGKTVTQLACLQLVATPPGSIDGGTVLVEGENVLKLPANGPRMRAIRGGKIGFVFQEPMTSLNPVKTVGSQLMEPILIHNRISDAKAKEKAINLLNQVGIPDAASRLKDYPHQFSGGMRQRIMVAIAIAGNPKLIIADEPTTALDVTTQAQILDLLVQSTVGSGAGLLIVTHNLGIVARYAQRIYVMYAGSVVENGNAADIFAHPSHPYTRGLLKALPRLDDDPDRRLIPIEGTPLTASELIVGCAFASRCPYAIEDCRKGSQPSLVALPEAGHFAACLLSRDRLDQMDRSHENDQKKHTKSPSTDTVLSVKNLTMRFAVKRGLLRRTVGYVTAVDNVSFDLSRGKTLGLVGESGCGKTTVAKCILKLYSGFTGTTTFNGRVFSDLTGERLRKERRNIQIIFQDPYSSLDPRKAAGDLVGEPLLIHRLTRSRAEYDKRVNELFVLVGLDPSLKDRVAHEFSGGQRQRIGIARALASNPDLIVCDEPISALDVSIQAQIINLLEDLQARLGISYLFIAHDLSVVKHISDNIYVMYLGRIVEFAACGDIYQNPLHPYTQALLAAIPIPDPSVESQRQKVIVPGEVPSLIKRPPGCGFSDRCPRVMPRCREESPLLESYDNNHQVACYLYKKES